MIIHVLLIHGLGRGLELDNGVVGLDEIEEAVEIYAEMLSIGGVFQRHGEWDFASLNLLDRAAEIEVENLPARG